MFDKIPSLNTFTFTTYWPQEMKCFILGYANPRRFTSCIFILIWITFRPDPPRRAHRCKGQFSAAFLCFQQSFLIFLLFVRWVFSMDIWLSWCWTVMLLCQPGSSDHDGLPADVRSVPDKTEEAHRQNDCHRAALRGRVPLCQLPPHHQQVSTPATAHTLLLQLWLWFSTP